MASVAKDAEIRAAQLDFVPAGRTVAAAAAVISGAIAQYCNLKVISEWSPRTFALSLLNFFEFNFKKSKKIESFCS